MIGLLRMMWAEANRRVLESQGYRPPASMNPRHHDPFGTWVARSTPDEPDYRGGVARRAFPRSAHFWDMFACFERGLKLGATYSRQFPPTPDGKAPLIRYSDVTLGDTVPTLSGSVTPPTDIPAGDDVVRVTMRACSTEN